MGDSRLGPLVLSDSRAADVAGLGEAAHDRAGAGAAGADRARLRGGWEQYGRLRTAGRQPEDGQPLAGPVPARPARRSGRRATPWGAAHHHRCPGRGGGGAHPRRVAPGRHALVEAGAGETGGDLALQCAADLAGVRPAALADRGLQDFSRSFADRQIRDGVGLYLAPPTNAAVFAVDEKPQIQALERTAPVLPMLPGVTQRRSFDYVRHGTVDLFAALNTAPEKVIGKLSAQHRATCPPQWRTGPRVPGPGRSLPHDRSSNAAYVQRNPEG
jgi:hypothetical protein